MSQNRYKVELHCHSIGDPIDRLNYTAKRAVDAAVENGVSVLAITWHRRIFDQPEIIDYARQKGLLLIPGVEAEIRRSHLLVLNVQPGDFRNPANITWDDVRALKKVKPNIFVIAPHPYYLLPSCLGTRKMNAGVDCIDAVEWCYLHLPLLPFSFTPNGLAEKWARQNSKRMIGTSDAHRDYNIGRFGSFIETDAEIPKTPEAFFHQLRSDTIVFDREAISLARLFRTVFDFICHLPKNLKYLLQPVESAR